MRPPSWARRTWAERSPLTLPRESWRTVDWECGEPTMRATSCFPSTGGIPSQRSRLS